MNVKKILATMLVASVVGFGMTACGGDNYNLECDKGDQLEHDSDCGYVDANNQWVWFSWVNQGKVSHSPDNWEPPAGVTIEQDEKEHKVPKKKSVTKKTSTRK